MHESWLAVLGDELERPHMVQLREFLVAEQAAGRGFYPPASLVFNALQLTPFDAVRAVILGQDPYHGPGQAMGLCFSVPKDVTAPPSLQNIFKELHSDLEQPAPTSGDLTPWAERGVLLLNAVLTVSTAKSRGRTQGRAGSCSPTGRSGSFPSVARGSCSCSGGGTRRRREVSSTVTAITS